MEAEGRTGLGEARSLVARIFRLWRLYASMDLLLLTRDVKLALSYFVSDAILNIAAITATLLLAERFDGIGHWTKFQVVFMLGYATLVSGLLSTFFSYNVLEISRRLGRGQLDHTLVQPQPVWMALLTEGFMPFSGSAILFPGFGLILWATHRLAVPVSPAWLALAALNLAASAAVALSFSFLWGSLAFWAPRAAEEVSSSSVRLIYQLKSFPLDGTGPILTGGLMTLLPVGLVAWAPCRALLGLDPSGWGGAVTPLAAVLFAALAGWVFRRGMREYARTGSQRYSSFGHRR
jgi:ABC-2 type transport system permease protein